MTETPLIHEQRRLLRAVREIGEEYSQAKASAQRALEGEQKAAKATLDQANGRADEQVAQARTLLEQAQNALKSKLQANPALLKALSETTLTFSDTDSSSSDPAERIRWFTQSARAALDRVRQSEYGGGGAGCALASLVCVITVIAGTNGGFFAGVAALMFGGAIAYFVALGRVA